MTSYIQAVLLTLLLIHFNEGMLCTQLYISPCMYAGKGRDRSSSSLDVTIKFDESRTTIREDTAGTIDVMITGQRRRSRDISITIRPITFGEFTDPLPSEFPPESLPDPAEGK